MHDSRILVSYNSPVKTGEQMRIRLQMPNHFGFVKDAKALFNQKGDAPGTDKKVYLEYKGDESSEKQSTFYGEAIFDRPGYRTFCIQINLNGKIEELRYDEETELATFSRSNEKAFWQTFIYQSTFETPDNIKGGIMYQIYVDTFYKKDLPENLQKRVVEWGTYPKWQPDEDGEYRNNQWFGGNLKGIISKLDYIESLSVTAIYLTPIFKSSTSDRYGIDDYEQIDELVGDFEDLELLHRSCNERNIPLILDVVFNHSGPNNPLLIVDPEIYEWEERYTKFRGWWGFDLPEFNKYCDRYFHHLEKWVTLYKGYVDGFRIDVADSLPDFVLKYLRNIFGKYLLLEVWKNAITGDFREFLFGDEGDGVMNYQFTNAFYRYIRFGNVQNFKKVLSSIITLYPKEALDVSPIFLSSHDIPRIPNILINELMKSSENFENVWDIDKDERWIENGVFNTYKFRKWEVENGSIPEEKKELALSLQKLVVFMQYTFPGLPSIFAGDEAGIEGLKDPDNRKTFPWDNIDKQRYDFYCEIGRFRIQNRDVFSDSRNFELLFIDEKRLIYRRRDILCVVNRSNEEFELEEKYRGEIIFEIGKIKNNIVSKYGAVAIKIK